MYQNKTHMDMQLEETLKETVSAHYKSFIDWPHFGMRWLNQYNNVYDTEHSVRISWEYL